MIQVTAINNEKMWVREERVMMVGPLMDRGVRALGRAVLYFDGLPPLPCKETVDELADRVLKGIIYEVGSNSAEGSGDSDGRTADRPEEGLVGPETDGDGSV